MNVCTRVCIYILFVCVMDEPLFDQDSSEMNTKRHNMTTKRCEMTCKEDLREPKQLHKHVKQLQRERDNNKNNDSRCYKMTTKSCKMTKAVRSLLSLGLHLNVWLKIL